MENIRSRYQRISQEDNNLENTFATMNFIRASIILSLTFSLFECAKDLDNYSDCGKITTSNRTMKVYMRTKRDESGEWLTDLSALKDSSVISNEIELDMTQRIIECQGSQKIHIQGIIRDLPIGRSSRSIYFHKKCSKNAAVTNDGLTLQKFNTDESATGITNRPLLENEIFRVRLDNKISKFNHAVGIGITTHDPAELDIPNHMYHVKTGTWMLYHTHLYNNGTAVIHNYSKINLKDLQIGDVVGVMKSKHNTLHFYVNGVDQGPAASNVLSPVYGVFDLYGNAVQGTIMN